MKKLNFFASAPSKPLLPPPSPQRLQGAEEDYLTGLDKLAQAEANAFHDKTALLAAYRHFSTAITKNETEPRYHTGMAYLLMVIGNPARAAQCIGTALRLDPENPRALLLQQSLKEVQKASPEAQRLARWNAFANLPWPQTSADYDWLYDEVESFINTELRILMQAPVSPEVTLNQSVFEAQESMYAQLHALKNQIQSKLEILEKEIDTQSFERLLQPLQTMHERFHKALAYHAEFQLLIDGFNLAYDQADELMAWFKTSSAAERKNSDFQTQVETLYDFCDELADELDQLSQHQDISLIESIYERVVQKTQKLQDLLDDETW